MPAVTLAAEAMATRFELVLIGDDEPRLRAVGEAAIAEILEWHARLNRFDRASDVGRINAAAGLAPVRVDARTFDLLRRCIDIGRQSGGRFDITVAPAMDAVFGEGAAGPAAIGSARIELDDSRRTVRLPEPGMGIDLGAIAKGWAIDAAGDVLREHGVRRALIHGGTSSVLAFGAPDDGRDGWHVAVRSPRLGEPGPVISLRDGALGVSELYGRSPEAGHVIDPARGAPARGTLVAGVAAPSAAMADAWSTAALVAGARPPGMDDSWGVFLLPDNGSWTFDGLRRGGSGRYTSRPQED